MSLSCACEALCGIVTGDDSVQGGDLLVTLDVAFEHLLTPSFVSLQGRKSFDRLFLCHTRSASRVAANPFIFADLGANRVHHLHDVSIANVLFESSDRLRFDS